VPLEGCGGFKVSASLKGWWQCLGMTVPPLGQREAHQKRQAVPSKASSRLDGDSGVVEPVFDVD